MKIRVERILSAEVEIEISDEEYKRLEEGDADLMQDLYDRTLEESKQVVMRPVTRSIFDEEDRMYI